jgi:hypothetical protein
MKKKATRASLLPKGLENVNLENTTKALNVATEDRGIDPCSEKRRHITEGRRKSAAEVGAPPSPAISAENQNWPQEADECMSIR